MSEFNLASLANYHSTTLNKSKSASMQQSYNSVLKELLRVKKPTSAKLAGELRNLSNVLSSC
jgi:hypothetical protein